MSYGGMCGIRTMPVFLFDQIFAVYQQRISGPLRQIFTIFYNVTYSLCNEHSILFMCNLIDQTEIINFNVRSI